MVASHPVLPWPIPSVRRPPEMSSSVMRTAAPARSRTQTGAAAKLTKLARVPTAAGSKRAGVQLLHHRDDHAAPLLRALLHRGRKQTCSPRRLHTNPTGAWVTQQARNLNLTHVLERTRFLIRDQATKFGGSLDEVFHGEGIKTIQTPIRAPQANAYAERFVRTVGAECLDWLLILSRRRWVPKPLSAARDHPDLQVQPSGDGPHG
jgi:transposase InsO family protein